MHRWSLYKIQKTISELCHYCVQWRNIYHLTITYASQNMSWFLQKLFKIQERPLCRQGKKYCYLHELPFSIWQYIRVNNLFHILGENCYYMHWRMSGWSSAVQVSAINRNHHGSTIEIESLWTYRTFTVSVTKKNQSENRSVWCKLSHKHNSYSDCRKGRVEVSHEREIPKRPHHIKSQALKKNLEWGGRKVIYFAVWRLPRWSPAVCVPIWLQRLISFALFSWLVWKNGTIGKYVSVPRILVPYGFNSHAV